MSDQPHIKQASEGRFNTGPGGSVSLENVFSYHAPFGDQIQRYQLIRDQAWELARTIEDLCPPSPERSSALHDLRSTVMWANASIACNEKNPDEEPSDRQRLGRNVEHDRRSVAYGEQRQQIKPGDDGLIHYSQDGNISHPVDPQYQNLATTNQRQVITCSVCLAESPRV